MAIFDEDDKTLKPSGHTVGEDLSALSVDELAGRIEQLEAEITRLRQAMTAKEATRSAADQLFKS